MMSITSRSFKSIGAVTLEQLVPAGHFYRQLDRTLDVIFVCPLTD